MRPKKGDQLMGDKALAELEGGQVVAAKRVTHYKRDTDKEGAGDDSRLQGELVYDGQGKRHQEFEAGVARLHEEELEERNK